MSPSNIGKTCPYCQFPIKRDSEIIVCSACKIPHHRECWLENGGCTTFGHQKWNRGERLNARVSEKTIGRNFNEHGSLLQKEQLKIQQGNQRYSGISLFLGLLAALIFPFTFPLLGLFIALIGFLYGITAKNALPHLRAGVARAGIIMCLFSILLNIWTLLYFGLLPWA